MSWTADEVKLVQGAVTKEKPTSLQLERIRLELKDKCKSNRSTSAIRHQVNKLKRPRLLEQKAAEKEEQDAVEELQNLVQEKDKRLTESNLLLWNAEWTEAASWDQFIAQMLKDLDTFAQVDTAHFRDLHKAILVEDVKSSRAQIASRQQLFRDMQLLFVQMIQLERKTSAAKLDEILHRKEMKESYQQRPQSFTLSYHHPPSSSSYSSSSRRSSSFRRS